MKTNRPRDKKPGRRPKKNIAVFLDRDGTICEDVGYLSSAEQLQLIPGAAEAIRLLNERGIKAVLITNQSGVARGFFSETRLKEIHELFIGMLGNQGAHLDGIYYCPHHPTEGSVPYLQDCDCRKPSSGLLKKAAADLDLDLQSSFVVGDHFSDVAAGLAVGGRGILVLTGHGGKTLEQKDTWPAPPSLIAPDLSAAVAWILAVTERQ